MDSTDAVQARGDDERRARIGRAIVGEVAARLARQLGGLVPVSDLESVGDEALVTLLRAHDPNASPLEPYLRRFLRWAMLDALRGRRLDSPLGGRTRGLAGCLWLGAAHDPRAEETAPASSTSGHGPWREALGMRAAALALARIGGSVVTDVPADSSRSPDRLVLREASRRAVRDALSAIGEPHARDILVRHYFGDEPFERIAADLGLSPPHVSKLHRRALGLLDAELRRRRADLEGP